MNKNKILIGSFIFLSIVISLFPPFSWGDERLRTISERQRIHYYYEDKIPIKEYDFLFNDLKKEFVFSNNTITLERHLIISELLLEIFIAFLLSVFLQFLYNRFSYKTLAIGIYLLTIILCLMLTYFIIDKTSSWFQPNYSSVLQVENKIKNEYEGLLSNRSVEELSRVVDNLRKGFRIEWDYSTNNFWDSFYSSIEIDKNQYPIISDFLEKNVEKRETKSRWHFVFTDWNKEFVLENFDIYSDYRPPTGYSVNYSKLLRQIDLVKYHILMNSFQNYPAYTSVVSEYRNNFDTYWRDTIPKTKIFTAIGIIIFISLIYYLKRESLLNKVKMYNETVEKGLIRRNILN